MPNPMPRVPSTVVPMASPGSLTAQVIWFFKIVANAVTGPKQLTSSDLQYIIVFSDN